jgi:hypothetical protein
MRTLPACLSILVAGAALSAPGLDKIRITDSKKTVEKRESSAQKLAHGTTSLTEKQIILTFGLQRMAPDVPETVTAAWVLIQEGRDGRLAEASRGTSVVVLPLGRTTSLETAPVTLVEREWSNRRKSGSLADSIAGYGLRILDAEGKVIAERYDPKSMQSEIRWETPEDGGGGRDGRLENRPRLERLLPRRFDEPKPR